MPVNNEAAPKYARLAEEWVRHAPEKAPEWANGLEFEAIRSKTLAALYRAWAREDRQGAFEALDRIDQGAAAERSLFGGMVDEVLNQNTGASKILKRG
ncbi:MAG: hypothetical protein R3F19_12740 [Verrucomicrobiales bacterium]